MDVVPVQNVEYCFLDGHKVRKYCIKSSEIPRLSFNDPTAIEHIANQVSIYFIYFYCCCFAHDLLTQQKGNWVVLKND